MSWSIRARLLTITAAALSPTMAVFAADDLESRWTRIGLLGGAALAAVLITRYVGRRLISEKIQQLAVAAEQMTGGEAAVLSKAPVSGDEYHRLAAGLDRVGRYLQQRESRSRELTRKLSAILACKHAIIRANDETSLFKDICRILCDLADYRMAWVGLAERDASGTIRPMAWAGAEDGYLIHVRMEWGDGPLGIGPIGDCIRSRNTCIIQDISSHQEFQPWSAEALRRGYRSLIALPFIEGHAEPLGALAIYSPQPMAFTPPEVRMLEELAADLTYGVRALRMRASRQQAEAEKQRKQLEEQLRLARDQANAAIVARDRFLAAASHQLRTPLTPALLLAGSLENNDALPEQFRGDLTTIREAIELEKRLVSDLLDFSAIQSSKLTMRHVVTALHQSILDAVALCRLDLDNKEIAISLELNATRDQLIGDPDRLRQIFRNILHNSARFTPVNGHVIVRTSNHGQMGTCTQIIDDGIGIDAETLPHIFLPFGQGSHVGTENHGGLGLGLSITQALVEAHGGSITGSSAGAGRGSTFSVYLPMLPLQHETPNAPHIPIRRATVQPLSALLVEDHAPTLRVLRQLLLADGHHVTAATSVTEALRAADQRTFDVLISDIGLPDGDGYHLMSTLRERQQLVGIAITGFGGDTDRQRSIEAGFAAHLIKPIQLQTLRETLIRVVAAARPADQ